MRRVYNLLTNTTSITSSTQILQGNDLVLYEEFKNIIVEKRNLSEARKDILAKIVDIRANEFGVSNTQLVVNQVGKLNNEYFESNAAHLSDNICEVFYDAHAIDSVKVSFTSFHKNLLDYMTQIISKMTPIDYELLIEITNSWKELIFFVLQPVFISVLGVNNTTI
jgi:hypothetical protein